MEGGQERKCPQHPRKHTVAGQVPVHAGQHVSTLTHARRCVSTWMDSVHTGRDVSILQREACVYINRHVSILASSVYTDSHISILTKRETGV